jgi:RNA polymerase sigma factor (sigma-70 family)
MPVEPLDPLTVARLLEDGAWLRSLARSVVSDPAAADDIAQSAAVLAFTRPPRRAEALRSWLRRVVRNLATDAHRSSLRRAGLEAACARREADEDTAQVVAQWEIRRQVVDAVLALDDPYRATLLLRFFEGLGLAEVAARQRAPVETVKTRQRRALDMLRARLAHLDDGAGRRGLAVLTVLARRGDGPGSAPAPSGLHASTGTVAGGLAMSALTKSLVVACLLATVAAGVWVLSAGERSDASTHVPTGPGGPGGARASRAKREDAAGAPAAEVLGASGTALVDLDPERDIHGFVVDGGDRPIGAAEVSAHPFEATTYLLDVMRGVRPASGAPLATTTSAGDGSFKLRLAAGSATLLRASAPGFATSEFPRLQAGERIRLVLRPATTLRVRVTAADGAAHPGAWVRAFSLGRPGGSPSFVRVGTTAGDGTVAWTDVPRGTAPAQIDVEPGAGRMPARVRTALADEDVNDVVVSLPTGRTLEGLVVDAETRNAVAGARVGLDPQRPPLATTDSGGRFRVHGWVDGPDALEGGGGRLAASAVGYPVQRAAVPAPGAPVEIRLRRGYEVVGVVVSDAGRPVADARVLAVASGTNADVADTLVSTVTDEAGAFRLGAVSRLDAAVCVITAPGRGEVRQALRPPSGSAELDLGTVVLAAARTVRGRVVDGAGVGLSGAKVKLCDDADAAFAPERRTGPDGRFAFDGVAPGLRRLIAANVSQPDPQVTVAVAAGADPEPVTLVANAPKSVLDGDSHVVRARVTDDEGNPVAGVRLRACYAANGVSPRDCTTGPDGVVDVKGAFPVMAVWVLLGDELLERYESPLHLPPLRRGQPGVDVVLRRKGGADTETISGRLLFADGTAVARGIVTSYRDGRRLGQVRAGDDGRFAIAVPRGATVDLAGDSLGGKRRRAFGDVAGVRAADAVEIRVAEPVGERSLDVVVVTRAGRPVEGAWVYGGAQSPGTDWRQPPSATTDVRGSATLEALPATAVSLSVRFRAPGADPNDWQEIRIAHVPTATTSLRVVDPGVRVVHGRVLRADGTPSPGAIAHGGSSMTAADAEGRFRLAVNADEPVPFVVYGHPLPQDPKQPLAGWDVVDAEDRELEIELGPVPAR